MTNILQLTKSQFWDKPKVLLVQTRLEAAKRTWSSPGIFYFLFLSKPSNLKPVTTFLNALYAN